MARPEKLTVVGAGPVGALLALTLARHGFKVDVYERRSDLRKTEIRAGRSINLAVSTRGLHALHAVGLDHEVLSQAVPMFGRMMHAVSKALSFQRYGKDNTQFINSMSRGGINKMLMDKAEASGNVQFHFHQRLVDHDLDRRLARFRDERTGDEHTVETKVLFGTDGTASALRTALVNAGRIQAEEAVLDSGYKELTMPAVADGHGLGEGGRFALEPHALHIWPRGNFMLIALPNQDGSFTCTLFLPFEAPSGQPSFARLPDAAAAQAFFEANFPDAVPLIPALGTAFHEAPLGQMTTITAWPWCYESALLLGDASHGIVPFFGQGMNSGFEDCTVLDGLLEEHLSRRGLAEVDFGAVFTQFANLRKVNTDAIAKLAVENFVEMRDRVGDEYFLLQKAVEVELQRRLPGKYLSRYVLVTFTRVPYHVALEAGRIQEGLLDTLCRGLKTPDQVDYAKAERLVEEQLVPFLRQHGVVRETV